MIHFQLSKFGGWFLVILAISGMGSSISTEPVELETATAFSAPILSLTENQVQKWWIESASPDSLIWFHLRNLPNDSDRLERVIVYYPDASKEPRLFSSLEKAAQTSATLLMELILTSRVDLYGEKAAAFQDLCEAISQETAIELNRFFLVGEGRRSDELLTFASNYAHRYGGILVWGGESGAAIPANLKDMPIVAMGKREELFALSPFIETMQRMDVPNRINSYWSEVGPFELSEDLNQSLEWMSRTERPVTSRELDHSTYLPRFGRHQWIWITETLYPGRLGRVQAEWRDYGQIRVETEGVRRFRVNLLSGLERPGSRVEVLLDSLKLPITIGKPFEAVEFTLSPNQERWIPRFVRFEDPLKDIEVAIIPDEGFEAGQILEGFGQFATQLLDVDCAADFVWKTAVPSGIMTDEDLYYSVEPESLAILRGPRTLLTGIQTWGERRLNVEFPLYCRPGARSEEGENSAPVILSLVEHGLLREYVRDTETELEIPKPIDINQQELVGRFLSKRFVP